MYIEKVPQPFLDDLVAGQVVPFVGSGFSFNANPPLPSFNRVAIELASQIPGYTYNGNPIDTLAAYQQAFSRTQLIEELATRLNPSGVEPGETILAFARLPFEQVVTTNFDSLLEKAYTELGVPVNTQVTEAQLAVNVAEDGVKLFKFHGDFNHPEDIIVTEPDYDAFISRFPLKATYLAYLLTAYTPFFIGYSLDDYDFRTVLRFVSEQINGFQRLGYIVQVGASPESVMQFRRRNVYVINYEGNPATDYPKVLTGLFSELLDYWLNQILDQTIITDSDLAASIGTSNVSPNTACFVDVPPQYLADYKRSLFPVIRESGYVPFTVNDMFIRNGGAAKNYAVAKLASRIISDCSSGLAPYYQNLYSDAKLFTILYNPKRPLTLQTTNPEIKQLQQRLTDWLKKTPS